VREHRSGDPRKEIHWKASARLGSLQTKLYEPATSLDAVFLLNVATYDQFWIQADPDGAELVISATAELIRLAADAGRQGGLVTNAVNIPVIGAEDLEVLGPYVPLAARLGHIAMELADGAVDLPPAVIRDDDPVDP